MAMIKVTNISDATVAFYLGGIQREIKEGEFAEYDDSLLKQVEQLVSTIPTKLTMEYDYPAGAPGANGKSAYELAVLGGFVGNEAAWLLSLKGADGQDGANGTNGTNGTDGKSAYELAVIGGFVGTEAEWLDSLKGADGADGADGQNGTNGTNGQDGADGQDGAPGADGDMNTAYVPGNAADWGTVVPTTLAEALDLLAAKNAPVTP